MPFGITRFIMLERHNILVRLLFTSRLLTHMLILCLPFHLRNRKSYWFQSLIPECAKDGFTHELPCNNPAGPRVEIWHNRDKEQYWANQPWSIISYVEYVHDETKSKFYLHRLSNTLKFIAEGVLFRSFQH